MSYAMLPDELLVGLEAAGITRDARLLYIEGLVHCATVPTDGDIRVRLERISDAEDPAALADALIAADLWVREASGYRIVRYLSAEGGHQRSREQVLRDRENNRKRQANYRQKVAESKARNAVTDTVTSGVSNAPLPIPSLPDPKGGEGRDEGSTEGALTRASATPSPEIESPRAEVIAGPHVFHDANFTALCSLCGEPEKAKGRHQISGIPKAVISGIAHKAVEAGAAVTVSASGSHLFRITAQADDWSMSAWAVMDDDADVRRFEYIELGLPFEPDVPTEAQHDAMRAALVGLCNSVAPHVGGNPSEPLHNYEADEGVLYVIFEPWDVRAGHRDAIAGMQAAFNSCLSRGFREAVRGVAIEAVQGVAA